MSRRASSPVRSLLLACGLPLAAFALLASAPPAHAGLGDMMKKAKDKALKSAEKKVDADAPAASEKCKVVFDQQTLELTEARVTGILATFKDAGDAGAGRPALVEKLDGLNNERSALFDKSGEAISAAKEKRVEIEGCYHNGYQAVQQRKAEEYKTRALSDPKLLEKYSKLAAENNAAAAKGDSAAINRLNQGILEEITPSKEDSAQVRKQCGPIPPKSAAEIRMEALDKQTRELQDQIAKLDEEVAKAQAKQRGMDGQQWFVALERIHMFMGWKQSKAKDKGDVACGLTAAECQVLDKHYDQLKAVLG